MKKIMYISLHYSRPNLTKFGEICYLQLIFARYKKLQCNKNILVSKLQVQVVVVSRLSSLKQFIILQRFDLEAVDNLDKLGSENRGFNVEIGFVMQAP